MLILDTNVVSEVMRGPAADPNVIAWLNQLTERPLTTVITRAEIMAGLAQLPTGRRRDQFTQAAQTAFAELGTVLPLTSEAADTYGLLRAARIRQGRPIAAMDALIAASCLASRASLATRNVRDFAGLGLELIDPWSKDAVATR